MFLQGLGGGRGRGVPMGGGGTLVWREFAELPEGPYLWKKIPNEEIKLHRLNIIYFLK